MNKKISIGIATSLILVAVTITFTATMIFSMRLFDSKVSSATERALMYEKVSEIDNIVRQNYYGEIDDEAISDALASGIIAGLGDPHSSYLTSQQIAARNAEMQGSTVSVGISVESNANGYAVINNVVSESPAAKMELEVGDVITKINEEDVLTIGFEEAASRILNCTEGTAMTLVYNRGGEEHSVELTPVSLEATTVIHSKIDDIYFIRIDRITDLTLNQFQSAIVAAQEAEGITGIVIDLRDLFGGYDLSIVAGMLDRLLPTGTIVSGIFKGGENKVLYTSDEESVSLPIAVIINENTVGFSELFAAVMSEADNCTLVGKTSRGYGTLQQLIKLTDGSGVDVTVAELVTPQGNRYNEDGVTPDYVVGVPDTFIRIATPNEQDDPQYAKACEVVRAA